MRDILLRPVDRAVLCLLAAFSVVRGLYLISPVRLPYADPMDSPLHSFLYFSDVAMSVYGLILFLTGVAIVAALSRQRAYFRLLAYALLIGFLVRLYAFIGVVAALDSWNPPTYLAQGTIIALFAIYWVFIKVRTSERISE